MKSHEEHTNEVLAGKTIESADVNGHGVTLKFTDGTRFDYDASDGGYSSWGIRDKDGNRI